jgi:hypothetical protein
MSIMFKTVSFSVRLQMRRTVATIWALLGTFRDHDYHVGASTTLRSVSSSFRSSVVDGHHPAGSHVGTLSEHDRDDHHQNLVGRRLESTDQICPQGQKDPSKTYHILPYKDSNLNDPAYDDLAEISSLAFTSRKDSSGRRYAYVVSDKEQFSLKVIRFDNYATPVGELTGDARVAAVYRLDGIGYSNDDWEDISLGPCSDETKETCIYIGNFGNNARNSEYDLRTHFEIFKFREPLFTGTDNTPKSQTVSVATIHYKYEDGGFHDGTYFYLDMVVNDATLLSRFPSDCQRLFHSFNTSCPFV